MKTLIFILFLLFLINTVACKQSNTTTFSEITCSNYTNDISYQISDYTINKFMYLDTINDDNNNTFMYSSELSQNDNLFFTIELHDATCVNSIEINDFYTESWALGDLKIYGSIDGINFELIQDLKFIAENQNNFINSILIQSKVKYLKFDMTYNGEGAFGSTPSFYISELNVIGE